MRPRWRAQGAVIQCLDEARPICLAGISAMLSSNGPTGSAASGRKIQQHLADQGLTFTALVEEVRRERALRLLRDTPRAVMDRPDAPGGPAASTQGNDALTPASE